MVLIFRHILSTIVFLTFTSLVFSQDYSFKYSEILNKEKEDRPFSFLHLNNQYYLFLGIKKTNKLNVFVYDSLLNNIFQSTIILEKNKFLSVEVIENSPYLFSSSTNSAGEEELYANKISMDGKLETSLMLVKNKNNGGYLTRYKVDVSENGKHIAVLIEHPYVKEKKEKISLIILNEDFSKKKKLDRTLELVNKTKRLNVPIISNQGYCYVLKRYWDKGNKYFLFCVKSDQISESELKLRNRKIADIEFALNNEGKLVVAGFFSSPIRFNFEGIFSLQFNNSTHPNYRKELYLNENIVHTFKHKKEIKDKGFGLDNFKAKELILDSLGNHYLIAEHHLKLKEKSGTKHTRKGLVVIKYSKEGNFIWGTPLLMNQQELNKKDAWCSSIAFIENGEINILYNKTDEGKSGKIEDVYGENTLFGTLRTTFTNLGLPNSSPLIGMHNESDQKFALNPKISLKVGKNIFLMTENEEKNRFRVVEVVFK